MAIKLYLDIHTCTEYTLYSFAEHLRDICFNEKVKGD